MDDIEREVIQEKRVDLIANTLCNDILIRALRGKKLLGLAEVDSLVRYTTKPFFNNIQIRNGFVM